MVSIVTAVSAGGKRGGIITVISIAAESVQVAINAGNISNAAA